MKRRARRNHTAAFKEKVALAAKEMKNDDYSGGDQRYRSGKRPATDGALTKLG
jgi:hypothetical protein